MKNEREPLERVIYISRRPPFAPPIDESRIGPFQRNNAADRLTGALLVFGDRYLQYLEGPAQPLRHRLGRIQGDPLHVDMQVLMHASGNDRYFGRWDMRLLRPSAMMLSHACQMIVELRVGDPQAGMVAFDLLWTAAQEVHNE